MEISKADWKLYRERVSDWQEHYMEQLNQEYVNLLTSPGNASDHFWELEKRIKQDKKHPGVLIELEYNQEISPDLTYSHCIFCQGSGNHTGRS